MKIIQKKVEIVGDVSVMTINEDSPVKDIFKIGDKIVSFTIGETEKPVTRPYNLVDALLSLYEGDIITVKFEREGEEFTVPLEITSAMMIKVE